MPETEQTDPQAPDALGDATATELVAELKTADKERAQAVWDQEASRPEEKQRVTVIRAAEDRLEELDLPGEPQDSIPEGPWAQLLDGDGNPVEVDGKPVATELIP